MALQSKSVVITGVITQRDKHFYNSIIALGDVEADQISRYDKHHLVPVGEYIPFETLFRSAFLKFNMSYNFLTKGAYLQENISVCDVNFLPAICFEVAFYPQIIDRILSIR